jgi:carboxypeptidase Q
MRILLLSLFILLAGPLPSVAQNSDSLATAAQLRDQAMRGSMAYALVESLTTEVGPRLAGSPADKVAAAWAEQKLKKLGFDRVFTEAFTIPRWDRGSEQAAIVAPYPQPLTITALGGSVATSKTALEAEVVLVPTFEDLLRLPEGALTGKIALLTQKTTSEAARRGAVAFLVRSLGTHSHRFAHTGNLRYDPLAPKIPAAALSPPDVELIERMASRGKPVRLRMQMSPRFSGTATTHNVIADIVGREKPQEIIVIGAHLDSWDLGTGALDDGAGVGIVMAAAKLIADLPQRPKRTIRLILFGAEEISLLGANDYIARRTREDIAQHMIGSESDFGAGPVYKLSLRVAPSALAGFESIMTILAPLGIVAGDNRAFGGPDMTPFRVADVPVFSLLQDGRDYFDYHHTPDDTLDKVDAKSLDQNVAAWAALSYWLAEQEDLSQLRPMIDGAAPRRPAGNYPQP